MQMSWALKNQKGFEQLINDFENEKVCYLPFNAFLFKPIQRLLHYKLLTESKWDFLPIRLFTLPNGIFYVDFVEFGYYMLSPLL